MYSAAPIAVCSEIKCDFSPTTSSAAVDSAIGGLGAGGGFGVRVCSIEAGKGDWLAIGCLGFFPSGAGWKSWAEWNLYTGNQYS